MVARRIFDDAARAYESAIAIHEIHQLSARRGGLYRVDLFRDCWCEKRHQSHRWTRWPGHHAGCAGRRRARRFRLCDGQRGVLEISVVSSYSGRGRTADFLRGDGGAGLAFLWYNTHPAQLFMGDVGALALGGALGTIAVIVRQEIVLFVMGGVFVAETLSVMLQVVWFKY